MTLGRYCVAICLLSLAACGSGNGERVSNYTDATRSSAPDLIENARSTISAPDDGLLLQEQSPGGVALAVAGRSDASSWNLLATQAASQGSTISQGVSMGSGTEVRSAFLECAGEIDPEEGSCSGAWSLVLRKPEAGELKEVSRIGAGDSQVLREVPGMVPAGRFGTQSYFVLGSGGVVPIAELWSVDETSGAWTHHAVPIQGDRSYCIDTDGSLVSIRLPAGQPLGIARPGDKATVPTVGEVEAERSDVDAQGRATRRSIKIKVDSMNSGLACTSAGPAIVGAGDVAWIGSASSARETLPNPLLGVEAIRRINWSSASDTITVTDHHGKDMALVAVSPAGPQGDSLTRLQEGEQVRSAVLDPVHKKFVAVVAKPSLSGAGGPETLLEVSAG